MNRLIFQPVEYSYTLCLSLVALLLTIIPVHANTATDYSADDFKHWLQAAYIADATYQSSEKLQKMMSTQGYSLTKSHQIPGYAVNYSLATNDKTRSHIIAIRGTANQENVIVDMSFKLVPDSITGIDIHQGFLLSAQDIYQHIKPLLISGYRINTIGHSLGGATALVLAMMLDAEGYNVGEVITFGQPKVTNFSGSQKYQHLNVTRIVTAKDMVPLVPPVDPIELMNLSIFWHNGTELVLFNDNRYSVLRGLDSMMRATDFLNDIPGEQHLNDHFMSTYINYLKSKLKDPVPVKFKSDFKLSDWFGTTTEKQSENNP